MRNPRFSFAAAALVLAGVAPAQVAFQESMTNWAHSSGGWTDDVTVTGSIGPAVDRLDSAASFLYTRTINALKKGHYVATVRIMKFNDATGVAKLTFEARSAGVATEDTIPFSQATSRWIYIQTVAFTVANDNDTVLFRLYNTDTTVTKQNYYFDWFKIGQVPEGKVLKYHSLDYDYAPWSGAWLGNATYFRWHIPEPTSAFGEVAQPNGVSWFEHKSFYGWDNTMPIHEMVLQPGVYTFNYRVFVPTSGQFDIDLIHNINAAGNVTRTWPIAEQAAGRWNLSPNVSFRVTQADSGLRFIFRNIVASAKFGYLIDSFLLRRGAFDVTGTACRSTAGPVNLTGNVPLLGEPFTTSVASCPSVAVFSIGAGKTTIDLTAAGAPGCTLYTLPVVTLGVVAQANVATLTLPIPNDPGLVGATWLQQAIVLDAAANKLGLATSEVGEAAIGG